MSTTDHVSTAFNTTHLRDGNEVTEVNEYLADAASASRPTVVAPAATGGVDASSAAARLLEIAARNADELLTEAKAEAAATLASAHAEAEHVTASSAAEADQVLAAARAEAETITARLEERRTEQTAELNRHRSTVLSELAERKAGLEAEVDRLQQQEHDHRDQMRRYFAEQLEQLDQAGPATSVESD